MSTECQWVEEVALRIWSFHDSLRIHVINPIRNLNRYANNVPLAEGEDALKVNWCELTTTDSEGTVLYRNSFITAFKITEKNLAALVASGRARWKIENENNHRSTHIRQLKL